jgi:hypothetical protein
MLMTGRRLALLAAAVWILPGARVSAQSAADERVVQMFVSPQTDEALVLIRIPLAVLAEANLPRLEQGRTDASGINPSLQLVAADVANNLEARQGEAALTASVLAAFVSAGSDTSFADVATAVEHLRTGRASLVQDPDAGDPFVDLELRYALRAGAGELSARLNAFHARGQTVRTVARYVLPSAPARVFSVAGSPARVVFDPGRGQVAAQFLARAIRTLGDGDQLWFLACIAVPVRRARDAARLVSAVALGQLLAVAASAARPATPAPPDMIGMIGMMAASAVVVAALQNIVKAHARWVWPLALLFGTWSGFVFGDVITLARPFAGDHPAVALAVFLPVIVLGECWLGALLWMSRTWLDNRGLPERMATLALSAVLAHDALHLVTERGSAIAGTPSSWARNPIGLLLLGWTAVLLLVGCVEALAGRAVESAAAHGHQPETAAGAP